MHENSEFIYLQTLQDDVRSEGILLIAKKNICCQLQPIFPECWGKRHLLAIAHLKHPSGFTKRVIFQAHYSNPRAQDSGHADFNFLHRNLRAKYPDDVIVVTGDFKRDEGDMRLIATNHQLFLSRLAKGRAFTR